MPEWDTPDIIARLLTKPANLAWLGPATNLAGQAEADVHAARQADAKLVQINGQTLLKRHACDPDDELTVEEVVLEAWATVVSSS